MEKGFTLIELLVYASIFAVLGVVLTSIFVVFLRVDMRETASAEVSNQANFILQRIQNYVNNASFLVVNNTGDDEMDGDPRAVPRNYLIIKDRGEINAVNDALSPIVIFKDGNFVKVQRGRGTLAATENLNSDKVKTTNLTFTKVSNPPGRDSVIINLTLEYNQPSLFQKISRTFSLGIGKAFAAVFDTPLEAGASSLDIGTGVNRWNNLFLGGTLNTNGAIVWNGAAAGIDNGVSFLRRGSFTQSLPIISGNQYYSFTKTINGVRLGNNIFITPANDLADNLVFIGAKVTSDDTITVRLSNVSSASSAATNNSFSYLIIQ